MESLLYRYIIFSGHTPKYTIPYLLEHPLVLWSLIGVGVALGLALLVYGMTLWV